MNKDIWKSLINFTPLRRYPTLPCPYCMGQTLAVDQNSIQYRKAVHPEKSAVLLKEQNSKKIEATVAFKEATWLGVLTSFAHALTDINKSPAKFVCFCICSNCKGQVSATGTALVSTSANNQLGYDLPAIKVEYFSPPIPIFPIHADIPDSVKSEVLQAFNHFHADTFSSGTKLRRSIEKLCQEMGFKGRNLHDSITEMAKSYPQEARLLNSLRLLGNDATHSDAVSEEDLLDAFEVQEFVLGIFERDKLKKQAEETAAKLTSKFDKPK